MNIISCDGCGVVLDKDKLSFPTEIWDDETESFDDAKGAYSVNSGRYVAKVECPVCRGDILDD